jgi:hypothetical protein
MVATGLCELDVEDFPADAGKDKAAQSLGQRGGKARRQSSDRARLELIAACFRWERRGLTKPFTSVLFPQMRERFGSSHAPDAHFRSA